MIVINRRKQIMSYIYSMAGLTSEPSDTELVSRHITNIETIKQVIFSKSSMSCWKGGDALLV